MAENYFIIHIETCPTDIDFYRKLDDEGQKKLMNPIDSKIVAIGIRYNGKNLVSMEKSEKEMLRDFWNEWENIQKIDKNTLVVGFNISHFDLPFITARSFLHDVSISPFLLTNIIDLRDKINAYRYGPTRGKLSEFATAIGVEAGEETDPVQLCTDKDMNKMKTNLVRDLQLIDILYERAKRTNILQIKKW